MRDIVSLFAGCALLVAPAFAQEDVAQETKPAPPKLSIALAQADPVALLESVQDHLKGGRPLAMWAAIAPTDREKVEGIVHGVAAKLDPAVYDEMAKLLGRVAGIVGKNAKFIAGNPMLNQSGKTAEEMERDVQGFVGVMETLTKSSLATHEGLSKLDLEAFVATTGHQLMTRVMKLAETEDSGIDMPNLTEAEIGQAMIDGDSATIDVTSEDGDVQEVTLKQVDGMWWIDVGNEIAEAAAELEDMPKMTKEDAMRVRGLVGMVAPMLRHFEDCESQEDFDEAVQQSFGLFGMLMGGAGAAGAPPGMPVPGAPPGGDR